MRFSLPPANLIRGIYMSQIFPLTGTTMTFKRYADLPTEPRSTEGTIYEDTSTGDTYIRRQNAWVRLQKSIDDYLPNVKQIYKEWLFRDAFLGRLEDIDIKGFKFHQGCAILNDSWTVNLQNIGDSDELSRSRRQIEAIIGRVRW